MVVGSTLRWYKKRGGVQRRAGPRRHGTGERFLLERVGEIDAQGDSVHVDMDGGAFQSGDTYLLFLKRQEEGPYYFQVNDQGRFHIVRGRLRAVNPHDAVAAAFHGRSVEEGITLMRERAEGR